MKTAYGIIMYNCNIKNYTLTPNNLQLITGLKFVQQSTACFTAYFEILLKI